MPSAYSSDLESRHRGDLGLDVRMDSATLAGKFIQQDVDENDVYINDKGFHSACISTVYVTPFSLLREFRD